jgi:glutathione transport system permease protein
MIRYTLTRVASSIVVLLGVTILASEMVNLSTNPVALLLAGHTASPAVVERLRHELGLDEPFYLQYLHFLQGALHGNLGNSITYQESAFDLVLSRLPATLELTSAAMALAIPVAFVVGTLSAMYPRSAIDYAGRALTLLGQSVPIYWLGIMFVLLFSVTLRWFPAGGNQQASSIVLPAVALGLYPMARITRTLRASLLDALSREYMQTARAKGLSAFAAVLKHALKNAAAAVLTMTALELGVLLGGSIVTETIFDWPGVGLLSIQAIESGDFPVVRAVVLIVAVLIIVVNLAADLLVAYLNPRVRLR